MQEQILSVKDFLVERIQRNAGIDVRILFGFRNGVDTDRGISVGVVRTAQAAEITGPAVVLLVIAGVARMMREESER